MLHWQQIAYVTLNQVTGIMVPTPGLWDAHQGSTPLPLESPSLTLSTQCAMAPSPLHTFPPHPWAASQSTYFAVHVRCLYPWLTRERYR